MANRSTEIGRIIRSGDLVLARLLVRKVIVASGGNLRAAARLLGVSWWTMMRIVPRLGLEKVVAETRAKTGWRRLERLLE